MHDLKSIRDDPRGFDQNLERRGEPPKSDQILSLDGERRSLQTELQRIQQTRNSSSKAIGEAKQLGNHEKAERLLAEVVGLKRTIQDFEEKERRLSDQLDELLADIPNTLAADVPNGLSEQDNIEVRSWGQPKIFDYPPADHVTLGEALSLMDFEMTAQISGSRFVTLKGALARLERALGAFMLDIHTQEHGYNEISPPLLVRDQAPFGVGQLPKFASELFQTTSNMWLISTAEVPLSNLVRGTIHAESSLPIRLVALTPCFRSEAGAAGKDTRGMIRMHQFYKVELVSIVSAEAGDAEHARLTQCAETVLQRLELPYRVVSLCAGDIGFASKRTYDIEVWLPSISAYREISSCSLFGDFQARRMNARYRLTDDTIEFVHTLNGSGLAVGRTLVAILENYQQTDGSIVIPHALLPYMDGLETIRPDERV